MTGNKHLTIIRKKIPSTGRGETGGETESQWNCLLWEFLTGWSKVLNKVQKSFYSMSQLYPFNSFGREMLQSVSSCSLKLTSSRKQVKSNFRLPTAIPLNPGCTLKSLEEP